MQSTKVVASLAAGVLFSVLGTGAFASDKWLGQQGDNWKEHITSTKTRAQVVAELRQPGQQAVVERGEDPRYPADTAVSSTRSRADVRAEVGLGRDNRRNADYIGGR